MEPFNITINHLGNDLTLTVMPTGNYYRLVYFGGIIGAVRKTEMSWAWLPENEIEISELPLYDYKMGVDDHEKLKLHEISLFEIGAAIEAELAEKN
ncbi:MAG: hypothetical protein EOO47_05635 [Flavobacterium sp.]|nr:MAG: hypothetical protein EOO47_05635 [Flavobacterium sp.]